MSLQIPLVVVHDGATEYVAHCIDSCLLCGITPILIGSSDFGRKVDFIPIDKYRDSSSEFRSFYLHRGVLPAWWECLCFERWFFVRELCQERGYERVMCIDSDVLMFATTDEVDAHSPNTIISSKDLSCSGWTLSQVVISRTELYQFCEFTLKDHYPNDMDAFTVFLKKTGASVLDLSIPHRGEAIDHNLAVCDGWECHWHEPTNRAAKNVYFGGGRAYATHRSCGRTRILGLHCWSTHKAEMEQYLKQAYA